jgi:hypothetical protein
MASVGPGHAVRAWNQNKAGLRPGQGQARAMPELDRGWARSELS